MRTTRTLRLRRERLADLGGGELTRVAGASRVPAVCYATREEGGCQWRHTFSPWETCLLRTVRCDTLLDCLVDTVDCA